MFQRHQVQTIAARMVEDGSPLIQVVVGPRQTGKSTMLSQTLESVDLERSFVSADDAIVPSPE